MTHSKPDALTSKPKLLQLQDALNLYGRHLDWCQKLAQMPTEPGRTYIHPTDWDNWRAKQPCTCKWEEAINALVRPAAETRAVPVDVVWQIMYRLTDLLSDDHFNNIEGIVRAAGVPFPPEGYDGRPSEKANSPQCTCGSPSPFLHANGCPVNGEVDT
jgi:hypothetical protein